MTEKVSFYNTLTRKIENIEPNDGKTIKMYCCGPTVYSYPHIGNLRTYVYEDLIARTLRVAGYDVKHVMNITDVGHLTSDADAGEDKMLLAAEREKMAVLDLARKYEDAFFRYTASLGLNRPDIVARATEHIQDMIEFVKKLEEKGYAYVSNGNVYFDTAKFPEYGKLSGQDRSELKHGARTEQDTSKRNPSDFVLWFTSSKFENQILQWDSPWGRGYPGWHIECSTMAMKYLGEHLDIHCGGIDHIPVHHENEIAQSEGYLGHKWVNNWIHMAFLQIKDGKMGKSQGNGLTLDTLAENGYKAEHYKYFCLMSHYKTSSNFSYEALETAKNSYETLIAKIRDFKSAAKTDNSTNPDVLNDAISRFNAFMFDDLKTPLALSVMWEVVRNNTMSPRDKLEFLGHVDKIFSMSLQKAIDAEETVVSAPAEVEELAKQRLVAKANKDWATADKLRDEIASHGFMVKDMPNNEYQLIPIEK